MLAKCLVQCEASGVDCRSLPVQKLSVMLLDIAN